MRMFASSLRRYVGNSSFKNLKKCLLHTLSAYISCDGRILGASGNLIYFIYINYAFLCLFNIEVGSLKQLQKNVFNILPYIARLRKSRCICNSKRHIKNLGQSLCQKGFSRTGRSDHNDVALLKFHIVIVLFGAVNSLVVVVDCNSQSLLGLILLNNILG